MPVKSTKSTICQLRKFSSLPIITGNMKNAILRIANEFELLIIPYERWVRRKESEHHKYKIVSCSPPVILKKYQFDGTSSLMQQ